MQRKTIQSDTVGDLIFITVVPPPWASGEEGILHAYEKLGEYLNSYEAELLHERAYGLLSVAGTVFRLRKSILATAGKPTSVPLTFVEGIPFGESAFTGIHAVAARPVGETVHNFIERNGNVCGCEYHGLEAQYLFLSDVGRLLPTSARGKRTRETRETIKLTDEILRERGWSYKDVRRTWFYLHDILDWYSDFNDVRNELYERMGLFRNDSETVIPASTGIWGRNPNRLSCTLDVIAIRPVEGRLFRVSRLRHPRQNEATDYGSAFSRGVSVTTGKCKYIFVSGTASIDEEGKSVHPGDMRSQTVRTIQNVESLLQTAGVRLDQIQYATAFVKNKEDVPLFEKVIRHNGIQNIPIIRTIADVCREDLLFEFEASTVIPIE